jgi:hypothetical protein
MEDKEMSKEIGYFHLLQSEVDLVLESIGRLCIHSTKLRDEEGYFQVQKEQVELVARQLRHAADVIETLLPRGEK